MLTTTAMVLLTFTATVTTTPTITPTSTPTRTIEEENKYLFDELTKCGNEADRAINDAYKKGWTEGFKDQWCSTQCGFLAIDEQNYRQYRDAVGEQKDDVEWYRERMHYWLNQVNETKRRMRKEKCDCTGRHKPEEEE